MCDPTEGFMEFQQFFTVSNNFVDLFRHHKYEYHILNLMNLSQSVFNGTYEMKKEQSHGECDFVEIKTREKYDAKLPFRPNQIELLTNGKKHRPMVKEWIEILQKEASEYNPLEIRSNPNYDVADTTLYKVMRCAVERDKEDENLIFFIPFPISMSVKGSIFLQFTTDYLQAIYMRLVHDIKMDKRKVYVIYPASEKNEFAIRELGIYHTEYIQYEGMEKYFSYELLNIDFQK